MLYKIIHLSSAVIRQRKRTGETGAETFFDCIDQLVSNLNIKIYVLFVGRNILSSVALFSALIAENKIMFHLVGTLFP